jgi:hypothetical protein
MASQLAARNYHLRFYIGKAIYDNDQIIGAGWKEQWDQLILQLLIKLQNLQQQQSQGSARTQPIIILLDALDECDEQFAIRQILSLLP